MVEDGGRYIELELTLELKLDREAEVGRKVNYYNFLPPSDLSLNLIKLDLDFLVRVVCVCMCEVGMVV